MGHDYLNKTETESKTDFPFHEEWQQLVLPCLTSEQSDQRVSKITHILSIFTSKIKNSNLTDKQ